MRHGLAFGLVGLMHSRLVMILLTSGKHRTARKRYIEVNVTYQLCFDIRSISYPLYAVSRVLIITPKPVHQPNIPKKPKNASRNAIFTGTRPSNPRSQSTTSYSPQMPDEPSSPDAVTSCYSLVVSCACEV